MRTQLLFFLSLLLLSACQITEPALAQRTIASPLTAPTLERSFWSFWSDGAAELAGYRLQKPRYGELRTGTAVTIFVKETFAASARVKSDPGVRDRSDEFPVMKLNLVEDFQTGVYDYNLMTSSFVALTPQAGRPAGSMSKISFSAQEWCGHTFQQLLFDQNSARETLRSYFDGEADQDNMLPYPDNAFAEDALFLWARGMAAPALAAGASQEVQLLPRLAAARLLHKPLAWQKATLSRGSAPEDIEVPAGRMVCEKYELRSEKRSVIVWVEQAVPHRIVRWESTEGEKGELLKSTRLRYWELHSEGDESYLQQLGLR